MPEYIQPLGEIAGQLNFNVQFISVCPRAKTSGQYAIAMREITEISFSSLNIPLTVV